MIRTKIILLILVMISLTNCTTQIADVTSRAETATHQATYTLTPNAKASETATRTPIPTNLPTIVPTLTWTPLPTLSAQQANAKIKELLETNGGCELPCWWGIVPNKTAWPEALHYVSPYIFQLEHGSPQIYYENGNKHTYTSFEFFYDVPGVAEPARVELGVKDDTVDRMTMYPPGTEYKYQLHQLLALLGPPKQILISAQSSSPISQLPPTVLVLDYGDIGVWGAYGYIPTQVGGNLVICPQSSLGKVSIYDNIGGRLELFDPDLDNPGALSIQEYADMVGGFTAKKLEDVTNMNIETFYNTFVGPKPSECLETPANLWP
jgi:hypothetical protein